MKDEFSAVCASLFIAILGAGCAACVAVGDWSSDLVRCLAVACNERVRTEQLKKLE